MAVEKRHNGQLKTGQYLGEISALCLLPLPAHLSSLPYLLAGSGSQLLVYDLVEGKLVNCFYVFQGIRVHGISSCEVRSGATGMTSSMFAFEIAVYGEKRVKLFSLQVFRNQQSQVCLDWTLLQTLPNFGNWVLDVCFLKWAYEGSSHEDNRCLAIGCSNNSVHLWDISKSSVVVEVQSPERSLLYSMRLWGDNLESLRLASGTIYNEIIVWKVVPWNDVSLLKSHVVESHVGQSCPYSNSFQHYHQHYKALHLSKLVGHEGSIFRIAWSYDGSKLVSVSDDRSAHVWEICAETKASDKSIGLLLFGHNARVWDCCISDSLIVTASEDCTCRVWGLDGKELQMIKEHVGRGIWRCLFDPNFSLLVTAGFDSAIKVHKLDASICVGLDRHVNGNVTERTESYTLRIPNSLDHIQLTDSKSEYVRCLRFTSQDTLYVATNRGYLYHAKLPDTGEVSWTEIIQIREEVPIVCMDILSKPFNYCGDIEDWVAVGDGKGNLTIIRIFGDICSPKVSLTFSWSAGQERQLLGTQWCRALGCGYIFTANHRGTLKLWRLGEPLQSVSDKFLGSYNISHIAEFTSCFGMRIMCLDASFEDEVLVCGDIRGNLILFPLLKSVLMGTSVALDRKISALNYFKGAHGISSVTSVTIAGLHSDQIEIRSTGADGCICHFKCERDCQNLEFIGMKQVKELSMVQSVSADVNSVKELSVGYAAGFASVDFMVWNLKTETKVMQIPCGGWRRPHSYYLGDLPEIKNCFAYVKDEIINIHKHWAADGEGKMFPQKLHMQFHGREVHSLCFISEELENGQNWKHELLSWPSWIATGCEDGTVRLTRYTTGVKSWSESKLLGEHVGGSAVRSICFVSNIHVVSTDTTNVLTSRIEKAELPESKYHPSLLISVGAKRVLTSWLLRNRKLDKKEEIFLKHQDYATEDGSASEVSSLLSFQWLSTDMPPKYSRPIPFSPENGKSKLKSCSTEKCEDDWRYLAVTAFLVKYAGSRLTICFVVVACSDTTLALRALVLPHRLWFDVALLAPLSSPVLALQHIITPMHLPTKVNIQYKSMYVVISGATDGSIAFWDLTGSIEAFMQRVSILNEEKLIECRMRPRTGRGSQGGRQWRYLGSDMSKSSAGSAANAAITVEGANNNSLNCITDVTSPAMNISENSLMSSSQANHTTSLKPEPEADETTSEICEVRPLFVLENVHQSGVNCLHVSDVKCSGSFDGVFLFQVVSGGDDQAIHSFRFELSLSLPNPESGTMGPTSKNSVDGYTNAEICDHYNDKQNSNIRLEVFNHYEVPSAHSSAVKGIWTDGSWVFSTGLDQRVRCWLIEKQSRLVEHAYVVITVPEPEALDAREWRRGHYQIAVAGRGMQIVEFSTIPT